MRLIIEIENDDELSKAQALLAALSPKSAQIRIRTKEDRMRNFMRWCEANKITVPDLKIPSREERNAR
ncbi:hypothetical protein [Gloeobacter morelensis]|uniref:Uncharacterized protein n=1 Tax=Gloeobacter morelensis MG652769 TaxID=2781736 RepID=A0ABY3PN35_9CYAN|nr:hypothetical protein [Gloeobacter morelensis]UFP95113.1 hypothetical protein ISF26_02345 [Gloeobacter morelensis MG652769]